MSSLAFLLRTQAWPEHRERSAAISRLVMASAARPSMTANSGSWTATLRSQRRISRRSPRGFGSYKVNEMW